MTILAIETSCDDTCIAVVKALDKKRANFSVLSNIVSSQVKIHQKWGGVYPTLAKREHQKNLPIVLKKALNKANKSLPAGRQVKIDLIAVTVGPGLEPCLWVGVNFAKKLVRDWKLPLVAVNHIKAHIFINILKSSKNFKELKLNFPIVCLVVSGGHTQLILMKDFGKYKILGETRDDAAGECFDKTARILGLGYPGGPIIEKIASKSLTSQASQCLPRPMLNQKNYDFSFSGLKTAVLYMYKKTPKKLKKERKYIQAMCAEIQQAVVDVLIKKTIKAARDFGAKTILVGGGVAANEQLRKQLAKTCKLKLKNCKIFIPKKQLCTDNAVMVAITGYFRWRQGKIENWENIEADANLRIC